MAAATHVTAGIYGTFQGGPPFTGADPSRINFWTTPVQQSFPGAGTVFHQVTPGIQVNNTANYIYSVIEVLPTGLNQKSEKYATNVALATLATNIG